MTGGTKASIVDARDRHAAGARVSSSREHRLKRVEGSYSHLDIEFTVFFFDRQVTSSLFFHSIDD